MAQPINHISRTRNIIEEAIFTINQLRNQLEEYQLNGYMPGGLRSLSDVDFIGVEVDITAEQYHTAMSVITTFLAGLSPDDLAALYTLRRG